MTDSEIDPRHYPALDAREYTRGNKAEDPEPHPHAGLLDDERLVRFLSLLEYHYDPEPGSDMPANVEDTRLYQLILRTGSTEALTRAVQSESPSVEAFFSGDPSRKSDVSGLRAIKQIEDVIIRPAPILYIYGPPGAGKTSISLLFGELWKREFPEGEIGTNIRTLEQSDRWIPSLPQLDDWLGQNIEEMDSGGIRQTDDADPKLFIFDEASSHASGRGKQGHEAGDKLAPLVYKIRKARAGLVIIGHDGKDVHPAVRTLATVVEKRRGEQKKAWLWEDVRDRQGHDLLAELSGIPDTSWSYDEHEATSWSWDDRGRTEDDPEEFSREDAEQLAREMTDRQIERFAVMLDQDTDLLQTEIAELVGRARGREPYDRSWVSRMKDKHSDLVDS